MKYTDNDFKQYAVTQDVDCVRTGWIGVWDAIVSALTRNPRLTISKKMTFSIYADKPVRLVAAQAEEHNP